MSGVVNLVRHNNRGDSWPDKNFLDHLREWDKTHPNEPTYGPIVRHTWQVNGVTYERLNPRNDSFDELPDTSGFLLCEKVERSDNLLLLDAYGKERMRLSIPWQLGRHPNPACANYPSGFMGLTTPWDNPKTGEKGKFAVLAWLEHGGGHYAFELNWQTGEFLWGYWLQRY